MPKITKIVHKPEKERYWVYVGGEYCTSIRDRTFPALNLKEGSEFTCEKIKELESFHFKNQYQNSWEKEKVRLHYQEPQEKFIFIKPDLSKSYKHNEVVIMQITEYYVFFNDAMDEFKTVDEFRQHLLSLL